MSPTLTTAARDHSQDMATQNYFDHTGLNGSTFSQRIAAAGYPGGTLAENIFAGDPTAQGAFDSWRNSPGHNANMLNPAYKAIGIGRATRCGTRTSAGTGPRHSVTWSMPPAVAQPLHSPRTAPPRPIRRARPPMPRAIKPEPRVTAREETRRLVAPNSDRDGDGLTDQDEVDFFGTNPDRFDTDGGGVGDGDEWFNFTDPLNPADDNAGPQGGGTAMTTVTETASATATSS